MKVEVNPSEQQLYEGVGIAYDMSTYVRFDKYGLYGIKNKSDFIAESPEDIEDNASFGITWKGFFIKNSYTNGYVSITEDDDFKVVKVVNGDEVNKIKIGALEKDENNNPTLYGISIRNDDNFEVFKTDDNGNLIANNITVSGSLRATTFEYEEIQAAGGTILVRPASSIKDAYYVEENNEEKLVVVVEKTVGFNVGDFCRISNTPDIISGESADLINGIGLIENIDQADKAITFSNISSGLGVEDLISGVLISLGSYTEEDNVASITKNYGIALNSGDSSNNFPSQSISLFTTDYHNSTNTIDYNYNTVIGTLPEQLVNNDIYNNSLAQTQGIFTDNIYFGNEKEYIAFYGYYDEQVSENKKRLDIHTNKIGFDSGSRLIIGNEQELHMEFVGTSEPGGLEAGIYFMNGGESTTYLSNDQLVIPKAVIVNEMGVGTNLEGTDAKWKWFSSNNNHLTLVYGG